MTNVFSQENLDKVFRSYDLRGIVGDQLNEEFAYRIGFVFAKQNDLKKCVVGRDLRESSPSFMDEVIRGVRDAGCDVVDAGIVSTPQIKWIVKTFGYPGGIMVTASHNPPEYNGFKLYGEGAMMIGKPTGSFDLKPFMQQDPVPESETGSLEAHDYVDEFADFLVGYLPKSDVHMYIDPAAGPAGREVHKVLEKGDYNVHLFNDAPDPTFSIRPPDPLTNEAQAPAVEYCKEHGCIGVLFDADADRALFIDEEGNAVQPDFFAAWMVTELAKPGYNVVSSVDGTRAIKDNTEAKGGSFSLCEVGTVYCQVQLLQHGKDFAIERSGHLHFSALGNSEMPIWVTLFTMKHLNGRRLADIMREIKKGYFKTDPLNYRVSDPKEVIAKAKDLFGPRGDIMEIDGIRVDTPDWWLNIRASNTEPVIRVSIEAMSQETFDEIFKEFEDFVAPFGEKDATSTH